MKNFYIWSDVGTQFRCHEYTDFLFDELAKDGILVNLSYLAEKHEKNSRDQHFSIVSKALERNEFLF